MKYIIKATRVEETLVTYITTLEGDSLEQVVTQLANDELDPLWEELNQYDTVLKSNYIDSEDAKDIIALNDTNLSATDKEYITSATVTNFEI